MEDYNIDIDSKIAMMMTNTSIDFFDDSEAEE